jgi:cytochrome bd-type quinol oxidase subunit 1
VGVAVDTAAAVAGGWAVRVAARAAWTVASISTSEMVELAVQAVVIISKITTNTGRILFTVGAPLK